MTEVAELLEEASRLDRQARAELVSSLLDGLGEISREVSDEKSLERLDELKSGKVQGLTEEEFWKACGRRE